jgi:hypothetical protein
MLATDIAVWLGAAIGAAGAVAGSLAGGIVAGYFSLRQSAAERERLAVRQMNRRTTEAGERCRAAYLEYIAAAQQLKDDTLTFDGTLPSDFKRRDVLILMRRLYPQHMAGYDTALSKVRLAAANATVHTAVAGFHDYLRRESQRAFERNAGAYDDWLAREDVLLRAMRADLGD